MSEITMSQDAMQAYVDETIRGNNEDQKNSINGMMQCETGTCSFAEKTMTFEFPILPWEANRVGQIHGGVICTAFDITLSALARFFAGQGFSPTVGLDVKYVRPAEIGDKLIVTAKATATGRRIIQLTGEAHRKSDGKLVATSASIFLNLVGK